MVTKQELQTLKEAIRDVPDFPKPGIVFKDISHILGSHELLDMACNALAETAGEAKIDKVVGIDARGFIFGSIVSNKIGAGFVPIRKKGKLPWQTEAKPYSLEYGEAEVEIHTDSIHPGEQILIVDDLLATGGTAAAAVELVRRLKGTIVSVTFLIELTFLNGRERLANAPLVESLIKF
jgi:adenine phosphoribosyltransferase